MLTDTIHNGFPVVEELVEAVSVCVVHVCASVHVIAIY